MYAFTDQEWAFFKRFFHSEKVQVLLTDSLQYRIENRLVFGSKVHNLGSVTVALFLSFYKYLDTLFITRQDETNAAALLLVAPRESMTLPELVLKIEGFFMKQGVRVKAHIDFFSNRMRIQGEEDEGVVFFMEGIPTWRLIYDSTNLDYPMVDCMILPELEAEIQATKFKSLITLDLRYQPKS